MKEFLTQKSSRVHRVAFDEEKLELTIEFTRGGTYTYFNVPEDVYISLVNAESVGKVINSLVKGKYGYKRG